MKRDRLAGNERCFLCRWYGTTKKWQRLHGRSRVICTSTIECKKRCEEVKKKLKGLGKFPRRSPSLLRVKFPTPRRIKIPHIGFAGTQSGLSPFQERKLRELLEDLRKNAGAHTLHHSDYLGADAEVHEIAQDLGFKIIIHPPLTPEKRAFCEGARRWMEPRPYMVGHQILILLTNCLVAAPKETETLKAATWGVIRMARRSEKRIFIVEP